MMAWGNILFRAKVLSCLLCSSSLHSKVGSGCVCVWLVTTKHTHVLPGLMFYPVIKLAQGRSGFLFSFASAAAAGRTLEAMLSFSHDDGMSETECITNASLHRPVLSFWSREVLLLRFSILQGFVQYWSSMTRRKGTCSKRKVSIRLSKWPWFHKDLGDTVSWLRCMSFPRKPVSEWLDSTSKVAMLVVKQQ